LKQYRIIFAVVLALACVSARAEKAKLTTHKAMMTQLASLDLIDDTSGSGRLQLTSIGQSVKGKDIPMVIVSDPSAPPETAKRLFIICRQHGNEPASTEAMLGLIQDLVLSTEDGTKDVLSKVAFYVVPMMNPDGADALRRRNANGADLNRDWLNLWQPETRCVRTAIDSVIPDVIIDEHEIASRYKGDFVESAGPNSGATPEVAAECEQMQKLVVGMLRTHDMGVTSYAIADQHPARLAHRYFPIHAGTKTILFESKLSGARQYQLQYRKELHVVGTMTVAKYLAGQQDHLTKRIVEYESRRWLMLASRGKKPPAKNSATRRK